MAKQEHTVSVPVSAAVCFRALERAAGTLDKFELKQRSEPRSLQWKVGNGWNGINTTVDVTLTSMGPNATKVSILAHHGAVMAGGGSNPRAIKMLMEPFEALIIASAMVQEGVACPKCGTVVPAGTKFCPNDGTPIGAVCPSCGTSNAPSAQFCANCGARLSG